MKRGGKDKERKWKEERMKVERTLNTVREESCGHIEIPDLRTITYE